MPALIYFKSLVVFPIDGTGITGPNYIPVHATTGRLLP